MALRTPQDPAVFSPSHSAAPVPLEVSPPVASRVEPAIEAPLPLGEMPAGRRGWLLDADPSRPDPRYAISTPSRERLRHLGFVPGTEIRALRRAPFGGPIEFELRGFRICLRPGDLGALRVRLER